LNSLNELIVAKLYVFYAKHIKCSMPFRNVPEKDVKVMKPIVDKQRQHRLGDYVVVGAIAAAFFFHWGWRSITTNLS